jgi:hypothetical protein
MALKAEQQELEDRMKANQVKLYTAVGTLRTSSLQQGGMILYRLTDPANGHTTVYIRSNDAKLGAMIGQFIGVSGEIVNDSQLNVRVVTSTGTEIVDQAKLGNGVAAQVMPPSMLPKAVSSNVK